MAVSGLLDSDFIVVPTNREEKVGVGRTAVK
jgi:hypothetical protein